MAEFLTPTDIGSRACMHCGVRRLDPTEGFTEDSKAASEIGFVRAGALAAAVSEGQGGDDEKSNSTYKRPLTF